MSTNTVRKSLVWGGFLILLGSMSLVERSVEVSPWAWAAAMTWAVLTLALGLVYYFRGEPEYWSMLGSVVFVLALNQASVQRGFARRDLPVSPPREPRRGETLSAPAGASGRSVMREATIRGRQARIRADHPIWYRCARERPGPWKYESSRSRAVGVLRPQVRSLRG